MKILSAEQRKDADAFTIANGITDKTLLERAARSVSEYIFANFERSTPIQIYCGRGNNGSDGLAVARLLKKRGYDVKVLIVGEAKAKADLFEEQLERLRSMQTVAIYELSDKSTLPDHTEETVIIDALVGSGIKGEIDDESVLAKVVTHINTHDGQTISIDVPSGMLLDEQTDGLSVAANHVITFERPPLAFLIEDNAEFVRNFEIAHIGINHSYMEDLPGPFFYTDHAVAAKLLKQRPREKFTSKDDYGHCLLVAGSKATPGAALLAASGALRSGAGRVSMHVPKLATDLLIGKHPELLVKHDDSNERITDVHFNAGEFDVVGIGPGIGTHHDTEEMLEDILARAELDTKLVLDADALNIMAANPEMLDMLPPKTILTPHHKEFERLAGGWRDGFELLDAVQGFVATHNITVVLKGHYTIIALPGGQLHFNATGNPGMATAGTGDVLLGVITSLIAQGWTIEEAAILGVYIHGAAGDLAANDKGMISMVASDLTDYLPVAFQEVAS